ASPVGAGGEEIEGTLGRKVTNDAVAYIRGIAELRGRNADWAEQAVREAVAASEREAVELNVVDLVAPDREALLAAVDGRTVETAAGSRTLRVAEAPLVEREMTLVEDFLYTISDPNIAFLLLSLGAAALFFELLNPGAILPGVVGGIAILLGLYSVGTLPVNYAALGLIFLAFGLFALEAFVTSYGILAVGGVVSLILGGLLLVSTDQPAFQINAWVVFITAGAIGAFFGFLVTAVLKVRKRQAFTGREAMIGAEATAKTALAPRGEVLVQGERWEAVLEEGEAAPGERVTVVDVEGLTLRVRKA
ncbi:MAG TPA: NfeD family protein, partial [Dehalococcoidia bacterium]